MELVSDDTDLRGWFELFKESKNSLKAVWLFYWPGIQVWSKLHERYFLADRKADAIWGLTQAQSDVVCLQAIFTKWNSVHQKAQSFHLTDLKKNSLFEEHSSIFCLVSLSWTDAPFLVMIKKKKADKTDYISPLDISMAWFSKEK